MSVVHCREVTNRTGEQAKNKDKRYTRTFQILTDNFTDGAKEVLAYPSLPKLGDVWQKVIAGDIIADTDEGAFCVNRRVEQVDREAYHNWIVYIEYAGEEDPVSEPPEVSWTTVKYQKVLQKDRSDPPILVANTVGDPFDGGITVDDSRFTLVIRKNLLTWDPVFAAQFKDSLNQFLFLVGAHPPGFNPGTCKLSEINADAVWRENRVDIHYWRRQVKIEIDLNGWDVELLNAGFNEIQGGKRRPIILPTGGKPSSPVPLTEAGEQIDPADTHLLHYRNFVRYPSKDWNLLNLEYDPGNGGL